MITELNKSLIRARVQLILSHPFYATLLLSRLPLKEDPTCQTAWTDGTCIAYNPAFIETLTTEEIKTLLAHEVMHVALLHTTRKGGRGAKKWNMATDFTINGLLKDEGFIMPDGALTNRAYAGMMAEKVYELIPDPPEKAEGEGSDGEVGNSGDPGGMGEVRTPEGTPQEVKQIEEETKAAVHQAVSAARMQGKLPAGLDRVIQDTLAPKVNWRDALQQFVADIARDDYTWRRPNPRFQHLGVVLPSLFSEKLAPITVAIDTSGSISQRDLEQFAGEIQSIMDTWNVDIHVIYCDSKVAGEDRFYGGDNVKLRMKGGGGTDFAPVMDRVRSGEETTCLIYFTDLCCNSYGTEPDCPVLWVHVCDGPNWRHWAHRPPFGAVIPMEV